MRFSAMGDVVLLVPVVRALVETYPDVEVTVVTRPKFASFFTDIERVVPFPADVDYTYTGIFGMRELFKKLLRKGNYEVVMDMHDHIRTMMLRSLFKIFGMPVVVFEKGRSEKHTFTQKENKRTTPLPHTVERYRKAFEKAGYPFTIGSPPYMVLKDSTREQTKEWLAKNNLVKKEKWIGIAPFAMHTSKIWPLQNYAGVMEKLIAKEPVKFFLFGGGEKEIAFFESLQKQFPDQVVIVAGQLKLKQELALMQQLDGMLCVDSSNMHLAALMGVPLLSVWGGTFPDVGFGPFRKGEESILQISREELPCRPCSVYGKEKCLRGDFACLTRITPDMVVARLEELK
ncbi:glycosyltransferase family 9 protein [Chryseolinea soli]|nr:glycosyltransferase family 9 protein [Chryseolinea soli]